MNKKFKKRNEHHQQSKNRILKPKNFLIKNLMIRSFHYTVGKTTGGSRIVRISYEKLEMPSITSYLLEWLH